MATDKTIEGGAHPTSTGWSRSLGVMNPLRAVWWLVTNVRFAILLLVLVVVVSLIGVLVPQMPANVRGDALLEEEWLATQEDRFGVLTEPMEAIGVFDVFHQRWFALLLAVTVASTAAYVVSRFPGIWQTITRPRKRVPDRYFEMAPHRVTVDAAVDADRLAEALKARRYRVETMVEGDATYLFADRFQWAQLGTLLTHAAIIVFILSAVVSRVDAFSSPLFMAEGSTLPVFPVSDPDQIQVEVTNVHSEFAADGQPLDYRTDMVIYRRGEEALRCSSTVNSPCSYDGYRFYQAAYFGFGAQLQVRDTATGNVIYDETLALSERAPAPRLRVSDGDRILFDEPVLLTDIVETPEGDYSAALVELDGGRTVTVWQASEADEIIVFEPAGEDAVRVTLSEGQTEVSGGLSISYVGTEGVPSFVVPDFPLPESVGEGSSGEALLQMANVVYGTDETSEGYTDAPTIHGEPRLTIIGLEAQPVVLGPGDSETIDGLEYTFEGQREFAGIDVRRDRSDMLVWLGAGATVIGLMITFWVPRRRLWAKITATRLSIAGQAPSHANYTRELADLARAAGAGVPNEETDTDD
jgi:cytochrome c biogenesis protein ResB